MDTMMKSSSLSGARMSQERAVQTTFQESTDDTVAGQLLGAFNRYADGEGYDKMALRYVAGSVIPFQKSPVNSMRAVMEHSPMAVTSIRFWKDLVDGTPAEKMRALSKVIAGTTLMMGVTKLAVEGDITGSAGEGEYGQMRAESMPPYHIRIGGTMFDYSRTGFIKALLATSADAIKHKAEDPESAQFSVLGLFMNATMADSAFSGTQDILEAVKRKDSSQFLEKATRSGLAIMTPARGVTATANELIFRGQVESSIAKEATDLKDVIYRTLANSTKSGLIGGALQTSDHFGVTNVYDEKLDTLGNEMFRYEEGFASRLLHFGGMKTTTLPQGEFKAQLLEYGVIKDALSPTDVYHTELNSVQNKAFNRELMHGSGGHEGLLSQYKRLFQTTQFKTAKPDSAQGLVDAMRTKAEKGLKIRMYGSDSDIRNHYADTEKKKFEASTNTISSADFTGVERHLYASGSESTRAKMEADLKDRRAKANKTAEAFQLSK